MGRAVEAPVTSGEPGVRNGCPRTERQPSRSRDWQIQAWKAYTV